MHQLKPVRLALIILSVLIIAVLAGCCCTGGLDDDDLSRNWKFIPDPEPPHAAVSATPASGLEPLVVQLDASESYDPDGEIVSFDWDYDGDGTYDLLDGGPTQDHTFTSLAASAVSYVETGQFNPTVRVTDNDGQTNIASTTVTIGDLLPPVAAGTASSAGPGITIADFDASASTDPDGTIVQFDWDFDRDGTFDLPNGGATPSHDYGDYGTFTAVLQVTDDDGLTDTTNVVAVLTEPGNVAPTAVLVAIPEFGHATLEVTWDASGSSDSDGTVVRFDWDLDNNGHFEVVNGGDSQQSTYPEGGSYSVSVRVYDDQGATADAQATTGVNNLPQAVLVSDPESGEAPHDVTWDASGSTDSDGTIEQYDWDMDNDGTFEVLDGGSTQAASYPVYGTYTVGVQVTDDTGGTAATTAVTKAQIGPTAVLYAEVSGMVIHAPKSISWNASSSTDDDGTIVQYDWDMDNDGTFEITAGGDSQYVHYPDGGTYAVGVRVTDDDGLTDSTTADLSMNDPPTAVINGSIERNLDAGTWTITWDATGSNDIDGAIARFDWDLQGDSLFEIFDGSIIQTDVVTIPEFYSAAVRVVDDLGATATAVATVFAATPPVAIILFDPPTGELPVTVSFDGSTSFDEDGGDIARYDWDLDGDGTYELIDAGALVDRVYETSVDVDVSLMVWDDEGETATATVLLFNDPPTAVLSGEAEVIQSNQIWDIYWDASASFDVDGTIVQYDWNLDSNPDFELIDDAPTQVTRVYAIDLYNASVRVTDEYGLTDEVTIGVQITTPPIATFTMDPPGGVAPLTVEFDATASFDPDGGSIVRYDWDFDGDGAFEVIDGGAVLSPTYEDIGTYLVALMVWDDEGETDTVSELLNVGDPREE